MRARLFAFLLLSPITAWAAITGTVMTIDGKPVSGARVSAYALETAQARQLRLLSKTPERPALASAETDAKGAFSLDPGKDPSYSVRVEAAGYAPAGRTVESNDDIGAIALTSAAQKKGKITAGGKPVAGAIVIWQGRATEMVAVTDAEGMYSIADPEKWAPRVTILHPDYGVVEDLLDRNMGKKATADQKIPAPAIIQGRVVAEDGSTPAAGAAILVDGWPAGKTGEDGSFTAKAKSKWEIVVAKSGDLSGMRARSAAESMTIRLGRGATISGVVRDVKTSAPLAGVDVSVTRGSRGPRFMRGAIPAAASTLTDAKGQYSLVVPPGEYLLGGRRVGYDFEDAPVTLAAAQKLAKNLTGTQMGHVSGLVQDDMKQAAAAAIISADVVTEDRDPFNRRRGFNFTGETIMSAPDGRFSTYVEPDSDVQLTARKKAFPEARSTAFKVSPGERRKGMTLIIPRGFAVTGHVVDRDGKPLSGVKVTSSEAASLVGGPPGMMRRALIVGGALPDDRVETDSEGNFTMRLKEGTHDFSFTREGFAPKNVPRQRVFANTPLLEVTLEPGAEISGRVVRGGVGVEGAGVVAMADVEPHMATTAADGSFRITDLPAGQTTLSVGKQDEFIQAIRSVIAPEADIVIEIPAGGRITGRVVDKTTRKPITTFQASVTAQRGGGMMMMGGPRGDRTFTSDDGTFVLENVPAGTVQMIVSAIGYTTARVPNLTVEGGKTLTDIEVTLDTGVRLYGKVTGPEGPIAGAGVRIELRGGPTQRMFGDTSTFTDANGEYSLDALEPGEKTIIFSHGRYPSQTRTVNLSGRESRLDVELSPGQHVTGVVVTEGGAPIAEGVVRASSAADLSFGREAQTDANGSFTFEGLSPSNYNFTAQKSGYASATVRDFDIRGGASPRIVLTSGGIVTGRVLGLKESELANARVIATGAGAYADSPVDASGNFRVEGVPIGTVRVWASTRGNFGAGRDSAWKSVEVSAGAPAQVDLEFNTGTVIRGRITRGGRPVAGAMVQFQPRSATAQTRSSATADSNGNYEVTGLEDGTYMVAIIDMERGSNQTTCEVRGSATFDIDLKVATVRGRVVDATTRQPIEGAEIQVRPSSTDTFMMFRSGATDASGTFIIDNVAPGTYSVRAQKTGFGHDAQDVTVTEGSPATIELKLSSSPGLTINLVDARTNIPINGSAYAVDAKGVVANEGFFDGSGTTIRLAIAPGQYRVTLNARGYAPRTVPLNSPGEQTVGLTPGGTLLIRSKSAEVLRGRLLDAAGQPHQPRNAYFPVDAAPGVATVRNVAPGSYTLQILGDGDKVITSVPVVISEGGTTDVQI